jgi:hypothetical protein
MVPSEPYFSSIALVAPIKAIISIIKLKYILIVSKVVINSRP